MSNVSGGGSGYGEAMKASPIQTWRSCCIQLRYNSREYKYIELQDMVVRKALIWRCNPHLLELIRIASTQQLRQQGGCRGNTHRKKK